MQNLHDDKNLDRLAREAADEFQPDDSLHSWEKLKPGLDRELPEKKEKKRRLIFFVFFFLLVGGGIVSALWLNGSGAKQPTNVTDKAPAPATAPVDKPSSDVTANTSAPVTKPQTSVDIVTNDVATNTSRSITPKRIDLRVNVGKQNQTTRRNNTVTKQDIVSNITNDISKNIISKNEVSKDVTKTNAVKNQPDASKEIKTDASKEQPVTDDKTPVEDKNKPVTENKTSSTKEQPAITEKTAITKAKATSNSRNPSVAASRWEFGAVYAPDISTVKFTHTQKPGTNVGLMVGYNISRRFTVQAGAIYTIKNYKSRGSDYHPPKGYWTEYVKLESVTADCDMWDIPINLRYNLVPKHRSNLFVSTGLSSYFMGSEDYDYRYYYANNPNPMSRYRTYDTNSKHWASILNFSIGYERQISKSFSIQAEPFFKQPLKGVGFGNVKLNSTGIYFSVKYKPVSKSRK
jgi:hypothetical protein